MTKEEKKQITSLIEEIKSCLRYDETWRCLAVTKPQKSYCYYELTARWFRKQKYKVELGYGTLPSERDCYITIYKKIKHKNRTMNNAEERAFERYPDYKEIDGEYVTQINKRKIFTEGYHQAEKDNELTWKDMKLIYEISCDTFDEHDGDFYNVSKIWKEALKRFLKEKRRSI